VRLVVEALERPFGGVRRGDHGLPPLDERQRHQQVVRERLDDGPGRPEATDARHVLRVAAVDERAVLGESVVPVPVLPDQPHLLESVERPVGRRPGDAEFVPGIALVHRLGRQRVEHPFASGQCLPEGPVPLGVLRSRPGHHRPTEPPVDSCVR